MIRGSNQGGGEIFSTRPACPGAHPACPGAHPACPVALPVSYATFTGSFLGVKRPGRDVDYPPRSSAEVKERVELYLYSSYGP